MSVRGGRASRGTRALLAVLLVGLAGLGAGCLDGGSPDDPDSARGQLQQWTRALVDVDGAALRTLADRPSLAVSADLLTDGVLAQGALAGQDVEVDVTDRGMGVVRYAISLPDQDLDAPGERPWWETELRTSGEMIGIGLPTVTVEAPGASAVRVGDEVVETGSLADEGRTFYLPPGGFEIGVAGGGRFVEHPAAQPWDTRTDRGALSLSSRLTPAGRSEVRRAIDRWVDTCTGRFTEDERPLRCPARLAYVGGLRTSTWTLDARPRTVVEPSSSGWTVTTPRPPLTRMTGTATDPGTGTPVAARDVVPFRVEGTVSVRGERLVVDLRG